MHAFTNTISVIRHAETISAADANARWFNYICSEGLFVVSDLNLRPNSPALTLYEPGAYQDFRATY